MRTRRDYDKKNDILGIHWGEQTEYSAELFGGKLILDFDEEDEVVGIEIFDYMEEIKKHNKKMDEIFKGADKEDGK